MQEHDGMPQELHPPYSKRELRTLTVTLSPASCAPVLHDGTRWQAVGTTHANTSALRREVLAEFFR
jgi:hypothetical protein